MIVSIAATQWSEHLLHPCSCREFHVLIGHSFSKVSLSLQAHNLDERAVFFFYPSEIFSVTSSSKKPPVQSKPTQGTPSKKVISVQNHFKIAPSFEHLISFKLSIWSCSTCVRKLF